MKLSVDMFTTPKVENWMGVVEKKLGYRVENELRAFGYKLLPGNDDIELVEK